MSYVHWEKMLEDERRYRGQIQMDLSRLKRELAEEKGKRLNYTEQVKLERPLSEGDQIKAAIRELFVDSRAGAVYSEDNPLRVQVHGVNGVAEKTLCLHKHLEKRGAVVMWYE